MYYLCLHFQSILRLNLRQFQPHFIELFFSFNDEFYGVP
jgi:hypothetical protein